jgi:acyl carrier protein
MSDIAARVKKIVAGYLGADADKVSESASFTEDLGADSLEIMEMVIALEEEFEVEISDGASESILTVGDAVRYIESVRTNQ